MGVLENYFSLGLRLGNLSVESAVSSPADLQRGSINVDNSGSRKTWGVRASVQTEAREPSLVSSPPIAIFCGAESRSMSKQNEPDVVLKSYFSSRLGLRDLSAESTVSSPADLQKRSKNVDDVDNVDNPGAKKTWLVRASV